MARRWSGRLDAVQGRGARFDAWCLTWCLGAWVLGCLGAWHLTGALAWAAVGHLGDVASAREAKPI
ncbi:hypothetical protein ACOALA_19685 [Alicyclobacillus acidoterrestris]|uniref:hypothetical protein n=1 Tax=Alicyclobacillus TaxID=29330 RepID=UPI001A8DC39C|nr:hypothetical protein [Alicyclobacillus suci]